MKIQNLPIFQDQSTFVWSLLYLHFIKGMVEDAVGLASSIYEQRFEFSDSMEKLVLELWETADSNTLVKIAKLAVWQHLFDDEKHIIIVAILFNKGEIDIRDAAELSSYLLGEKSNQLDEKIKYIVDVSWLINEDLKDNFMRPADDNLLAEALQGLYSLVVINPPKVN